MKRTALRVVPSLHALGGRWLPAVLLAAMCGSTLTACVPLVVGAAAGGTWIALDRRTSGAQLDDEGIEARGVNRIETALQGRGHVAVLSYNRIMLLTGQVAAEADRQLAETTAKGVPNVRSVVNEVTVGPTASLSRRAGDATLSTRVKTALIGTTGLRSNAIKVTSELGTVYLMGIVTAREADMAANAARDVNGVLKVVKVFEIVAEDATNNASMIPAVTGPLPAGATSMPAGSSPAPAAVTTP